MQDMFENAKRVANTAVERAAWEADKMRRTGARQRDIEFAQRERAALLDQLATAVLDMEQRGQLAGTPLKALAERLRWIDTEVTRGQAEIVAIRSETFTPGSIAINISRKGGATSPCPTCHAPVRSNAAYCSACGARLQH